MRLYEIETGYVGASYERCYVWAESEGRARELFGLRFPDREPFRISLLLNASDEEFMTGLCDEGFGERSK